MYFWYIVMVVYMINFYIIVTVVKGAKIFSLFSRFTLFRLLNVFMSLNSPLFLTYASVILLSY